MIKLLTIKYIKNNDIDSNTIGLNSHIIVDDIFNCGVNYITLALLKHGCQHQNIT